MLAHVTTSSLSTSAACSSLAWTRRALGKQVDVGADHAGQHRVAAGGLVVGKKNDRLAVAWHLDAAERQAQRGDIRAQPVT